MEEKDERLVRELIALGKANIESAKEYKTEKEHSRMLNIMLVILLAACFVFGAVIFCINENGWRQYLAQYDFSTETYAADATGSGTAIIGGEGDINVGAGTKNGSEKNPQK